MTFLPVGIDVTDPGGGAVARSQCHFVCRHGRGAYNEPSRAQTAVGKSPGAESKASWRMRDQRQRKAKKTTKRRPWRNATTACTATRRKTPAASMEASKFVTRSDVW